MKNITITFLFLILGFTAFAQVPGDSLSIKKSWGTNTIQQDGKTLRMNEVMDVMKFNRTALNDMQKAKSNMTWASVFGAIGGGLIGWPLGVAIAGGDPPWILAGIGAGFIVAAIPFNNKYNEYAEDAVDHYNATLAVESNRTPLKLKLGTTTHGVGIALIF